MRFPLNKKKWLKVLSHLTVVAILLVVYVSCKISYRFTGASIPETAKTFSVAYFPNQAEFVNPNLSQDFTEYLKDFFQRQTRLQLVEQNGDFQFEGEIVEYRIVPQAISGDASAAMTRLTVGVNVRCYNLADPDKDFEQKFSAFAEFESTLSLDEATPTLLEEIQLQIAEDLFNKAFTDW